VHGGEKQSNDTSFQRTPSGPRPPPADKKKPAYIPPRLPYPSLLHGMCEGKGRDLWQPQRPPHRMDAAELAGPAATAEDEADQMPEQLRAEHRRQQPELRQPHRRHPPARPPNRAPFAPRVAAAAAAAAAAGRAAVPAAPAPASLPEHQAVALVPARPLAALKAMIEPHRCSNGRPCNR